MEIGFPSFILKYSYLQQTLNDVALFILSLGSVEKYVIDSSSWSFMFLPKNNIEAPFLACLVFYASIEAEADHVCRGVTSR